ncbi:MAG TPA: TMEM175 family protein [Thermomicrobiales bacterium]|nr:TMEM175 family protein [Thermomicrobiales bacterium]
MPEPREAGVERLLAFSDAVFAIAVTLLVLDLREPDVPHGLLAALIAQWPSYLGYVLSFLIVGIIWALHHRVFQIIRRTDYVFILINVVFLMWVAVVPFPTAILSSYLENPSEQQTAVAIYAGLFVVGSLLGNLLWRYAIHRDRLLGAQVDRAAVRKLTVAFAAGPVLNLVALALSFVNPPATIALILIINLFFAVAPLLPLDRWIG